MEKIENDINYIELLNEIKTTIKNSGFPIDYRKSYEIDKIIKPIIEAINKKEGELPDDFKEIEKRLGNRTIFYYYFALYQDNVDLLKELSKQDFNWDNDSVRDNIFLLDKNLSSNFSLKHYLFLIRYCKEELHDFYEEINSTIPNPKVVHENKKNLIREMNVIYQKLYQNNTLSTEDKEIFLQRLKEITLELKNYRIDCYSKEEKEKAYKEFSEIMTISPFVCKKKELDLFGRSTYNILSPYVMEAFGTKGILDLKEKQKQIISQIDNRNKDLIEMTKTFIEEYPDYSGNISFKKEILDNFSNEEIATLTNEEEKVYNKALSINSCKRIKDLKDKGFSFENNLDLINPILLSTLSDEELLELTDKDIKRIDRILKDAAHLVQTEKSSLREEIKKVVNRRNFIESVKRRIF